MALFEQKYGRVPDDPGVPVHDFTKDNRSDVKKSQEEEAQDAGTQGGQMASNSQLATGAVVIAVLVLLAWWLFGVRLP